MTFEAGKSGNPKGKAKGTRHRTTMAAQALLDGEAEGLTRKAVELALSGDTVALRLCLDRVLPLRKGRPVRFRMPTLQTAADIVTVLGSVAEQVATGVLTPEEGALVGSLLEQHRRALEMVQIEERLAVLERKAADVQADRQSATRDRRRV